MIRPTIILYADGVSIRVRTERFNCYYYPENAENTCAFSGVVAFMVSLRMGSAGAVKVYQS